MEANPILPSTMKSSATSSKTPSGLTLIWYDQTINVEDDISSKMIEQLRHINDCIIFCTTEQRCQDYIRSIVHEKVFLIIQGEISSTMLHDCEQIYQVDTIFGLDSTPEKYQDFQQQYPKLFGIYSSQTDLLIDLKNHINVFERDQSQTFSFYQKQSEKSIRDLSKESASFLWFQLFKDLLDRLPRTNNSKQELINYCRQYYHNNEEELKFIDEFQNAYIAENAIQWYTRESFLYRLLNKTLRTEDITNLYTFRFFIVDLSASLAREHGKLKEENPRTTVMLYRGLKLDQKEHFILKTNESGIISVNGFFSTTRSKSIALDFVRKTSKRSNVFSVLYEIECNISDDGIIFADIAPFSTYPDEEEVLFDIGTTFQIESMSTDTIDSNLWIIRMKAVSDGRRIAKDYIEFNRKQEDDMSASIIFGKFLTLMGKYDQSLSYFQNLLSENEDHARIYNNIASNYLSKAQYDRAIENYEHAYELMINAQPSPRIKDSARPLTNMGNVFRECGQLDRALTMYFRALEIVEEYHGKEHLQTAIIHFHIGNSYYEKEHFHQALEFHEKSLRIREQLLPPVHIRLAQTLTSIGRVYTELHEYDRALNYHEKSLQMFEQLLPWEHDDIASCLMNIALVLHKKQEFVSALDRYFSALKIRQKIFGDNHGHPQLAATRRRIGLIYEEQQNVKLAQIYYENALSMNLRLLPHDHPDILLLKSDLIRLEQKYITTPISNNNL